MPAHGYSSHNSTLALAVTASALTLDTPNWITASRQTLVWNNQPGDPSTWSFELLNEIFNRAFALANSVDPAPSRLNFTLGQVPPG